MSFRISKDFDFAASHSLLDLPDGHKCARLHGHNYVVRLVLEADDLDRHGFVQDFGDLRPLKDYIDLSLDHRHLNEVLDNPTSERLAAHLYAVAWQWFPHLKKVGVSETPKTWAWYTP